MVVEWGGGASQAVQRCILICKVTLNKRASGAGTGTTSGCVGAGAHGFSSRKRARIASTHFLHAACRSGAREDRS